MSLCRYLVICLTLTITACAPGLKQWTQQELSPYLVKELTQYPRFKQEPLILVDMHGERVEPQIDELTAAVREQVFNDLLQADGSNIVWQASLNSLQHHRRLQDLQCHPRQKARYYIGFDLKPVGRQYQLTVKALDPEQGRWVSGFGKTWQGKLTSDQRKQLSTSHTDEMLRGLRPLPFTEKQMDLLADYLAKNTSCLLQQSEFEALYIYPDSARLQAEFLQNTLALVGNYLTRFNEVHIVNTREKANIILTLQSHRIDSELHQLWLLAEDKQTGINLKGIDTAAYVALSDKALAARKPEPVQPLIVPEKPEPIVVKPEPVQPAIVKAQLFGTLALISPVGEPFCHTSNPWVMGEYRISGNQSIPHCFGLSISLNNNGELFLINENNRGHVMRMLPDNGQARFQLFAGERIRYPEQNLFVPESAYASETIHVIAVNNKQVADQLNRLLQILPVCCKQAGVNKTSDWKHRLQALQQQYGAFIDWRSIIINN